MKIYRQKYYIDSKFQIDKDLLVKIQGLDKKYSPDFRCPRVPLNRIKGDIMTTSSTETKQIPWLFRVEVHMGSA
jgi:hypothetical protein